jgi:hypothetical protein
MGEPLMTANVVKDVMAKLPPVQSQNAADAAFWGRDFLAVLINAAPKSRRAQ